MNSFNHYSLGSCGEWMFDTVAGIGLDPDQPGFKHIIIHPRPGGGLTHARAPSILSTAKSPQSGCFNTELLAGCHDSHQHDGHRRVADDQRGFGAGKWKTRHRIQ